MKLKSLAVIALLVLGCSFASAQSYSFGFASTGGGQDCNYEQFNNLSALGKDVWQGYDNLSACGSSINSTIVGFSQSIPYSAGLPVEGAGVMYADDIYDAFAEGYTGAQWLLFTKTKCDKKFPNGKYGWVGFASVSGIIFGDNYGYLTCNLPTDDDESVRARGTTVGKIALPARVAKQ